MAERKQIRLREEITKHAAEFLEKESDDDFLITVTNVDLSPDLRRATILISVFPDSKEQQALNFVGRHTRNFRAYLAAHARLRRSPHVHFALDLGEQNRRRIDELLRE